MDTLEDSVRKAVDLHLPGRTILAIKDRGEWCRRLIEVSLDGNEKVLIKISVLDGEIGNVPFDYGGGNKFLEEHGLPAAHVLAADNSKTIFKYPYVIEEYVGGTRLGTLLNQVNEADAQAIFETIGHVYHKLHSIHGKRSGIWLDGDPEKVVGDPNDFMFRMEILEGSGKKAVEEGRVNRRTYYRAVALWAQNMDYLNNHQPTAVHGSPLPWSIYLTKENNQWHVTKLTALGVQWWDPATDISYLKYLPFTNPKPEYWEAFIRGYGPTPEKRRILLYTILFRFMAAMGAFREPKTAQNRAWADKCLQDLNLLMDEIEKET